MALWSNIQVGVAQLSHGLHKPFKSCMQRIGRILPPRESAPSSTGGKWTLVETNRPPSLHGRGSSISVSSAGGVGSSTSQARQEAF